MQTDKFERRLQVLFLLLSLVMVASAAMACGYGGASWPWTKVAVILGLVSSYCLFLVTFCDGPVRFDSEARRVAVGYLVMLTLVAVAPPARLWVAGALLLVSSATVMSLVPIVWRLWDIDGDESEMGVHV